MLLGVGELIYLLYRPLTIIMFKPFELSGTMSFVYTLRKTSLFPPYEGVPEWIVYSLPDGLWLLSFFFLMEYIWYGETSHKKYVFTIFISIMIVVWEVLQYIGIMPGTWDKKDLLAYLFAIVFYHLIIMKYGKKDFF